MANIVRRGERGIPDLRRQLDRLFEEFFQPGFIGGGGNLPTEFVPQLEIGETEQGYVLRAELPGVDPNKIELDISEDVLSLRGEKEKESHEARGGYEYSERSYGSFARSIRLPPGIDTAKIEAEFDNGVLNVRIPKGEAAKARRIPLGAGEKGKEQKAEGQKGGSVAVKQGGGSNVPSKL
jgi:HSP20 family protein